MYARTCTCTYHISPDLDNKQFLVSIEVHEWCSSTGPAGLVSRIALLITDDYTTVLSLRCTVLHNTVVFRCRVY
jgi:hypothetical protein